MISGVLTTFLVAGFLVAAPAMADDGVGDHAAPEDELALPPGVEIVSARQQRSRTFTTAEPGKFRTELFANPIHYADDAGALRPIDPSLHGTPGDHVTNTGDVVDVEIATSSGADQLASVDLPSGESVSFGMAETATVNGEVGEQSVSFDNVQPGTDLVLTSVPGGVKEQIVLASPASPRAFDFPLHLDGLTASVAESGAVSLADGDGIERATIPRGWMIDSDGGDPESGNVSYGVSYDLVGDAQAPVLRVTLDESWLDDPARVWPVTVDPTVMRAHGTTSNGDTWIDQALPTTNFKDDNYLRIGVVNGEKRRALLKFHTLNNFEGTTISEAKLRMYNWTGATCDPKRSVVSRVKPIDNGTPSDPLDDNDWGILNVTWDTRPETSQISGAEANESHGKSPGCANDYIYYPLTTAVRNWSGALGANVQWENNGLMVWSDESDTSMEDGQRKINKGFSSAEAALGETYPGRYPVLVVTWTGNVTATVSSWARDIANGTTSYNVTVKAPGASVDGEPCADSCYLELQGAQQQSNGSMANIALVRTSTLKTNLSGLPSATFTATAAPMAGYTHVRGRVRNAAGNDVWEGDWVAVDTPPEVPQLLSPADGTSTGSLTPVLKATYHDPDDRSNGQLHFQLLDDETIVQTYQATGLADGATVSWTPSALLSEHPYKWRVRAFDDTTWMPSMWEEAPSRTVIPDTAGPAISTIISSSHPTESDWHATNQAEMSWGATDGASQVAGYSHVIDTNPDTAAPADAVTSTTTSSATLPDGVHYLHVRASDSLGNLGDTSHYRFQVDSTPPTAPTIQSLTHPDPTQAYAAGDLELDWAVADTSPVVEHSYVLDQSATTEADTTPEGRSKSYKPEPPADGVWYFHVRSQNAAGLWSDTSHFKVQIDHLYGSTPASPSSGPHVVSTEFPPAKWSGDTRDGSFTFTPVQNDAEYYEFSMDGGPPSLSVDPEATFTGLAEGFHTLAVATYADGEKSDVTEYEFGVGNEVSLELDSSNSVSSTMAELEQLDIAVSNVELTLDAENAEDEVTVRVETYPGMSAGEMAALVEETTREVLAEHQESLSSALSEFGPSDYPTDAPSPDEEFVLQSSDAELDLVAENLVDVSSIPVTAVQVEPVTAGSLEELESSTLVDTAEEIITDPPLEAAAGGMNDEGECLGVWWPYKGIMDARASRERTDRRVITQTFIWSPWRLRTFKDCSTNLGYEMDTGFHSHGGTYFGHGAGASTNMKRSYEDTQLGDHADTWRTISVGTASVHSLEAGKMYNTVMVRTIGKDDYDRAYNFSQAQRRMRGCTWDWEYCFAPRNGEFHIEPADWFTAPGRRSWWD